MSPERMLEHPELVDRIFQKSKLYTKASGPSPKSPMVSVAAWLKSRTEALRKRRPLTMSMDNRYMLESLGEYQRRAHNEFLGKGISPKPRMMELLATDLRFKQFDHGALADAVIFWFRSGPRPDLDDPTLKGKPSWQKFRRI